MPQETPTKALFWSELDALGEDAVLLELRVEKQWGNPPGGAKYALVLLWLESQESARALAASDKRDAREERTLSMASEALSIAKEANRIASEDLEAARASAASAARQALWARWAAIIATVAAIVAASTQIHELITWLHK